MEEKQLLRRLRRGDADALSRIIDMYSAYLYTIIQNIIRPPLQPEDIEEVLSDVFLRLWEKADSVEPGSLRAWLGAVARNRAKDKLRSLHLALPLEDDCIEGFVPGPEEVTIRREARQAAREAVESMGEPDRSIFVRFYYFYQKTEDIAAALHLQPGAVRVRLSRGREKLKAVLTERGLAE